VCTGSLTLGAAGLLRDYRATSHWYVRDHLALLGAEPVHQRVVTDRNRMTGGGVAAGVDLGLTLCTALRGEDYARRVQLLLEYAPAPPVNAGSPESAGEATVKEVLSRRSPLIAEPPSGPLRNSDSFPGMTSQCREVSIGLVIPRPEVSHVAPRKSILYNVRCRVPDCWRFGRIAGTPRSQLQGSA
jgi:hypothetical protein